MIPFSIVCLKKFNSMIKKISPLNRVIYFLSANFIYLYYNKNILFGKLN